MKWMVGSFAARSSLGEEARPVVPFPTCKACMMFCSAQKSEYSVCKKTIHMGTKVVSVQEKLEEVIELLQIPMRNEGITFVHNCLKRRQKKETEIVPGKKVRYYLITAGLMNYINSIIWKNLHGRAHQKGQARFSCPSTSSPYPYEPVNKNCFCSVSYIAFTLSLGNLPEARAHFSSINTRDHYGFTNLVAYQLYYIKSFLNSIATHVAEEIT